MTTTTSWDLFTDWCTAHGRIPLPASEEAVRQFLSTTTAATSTHARRRAAISAAHRDAGLPDPCPPGVGRRCRLLTDPAGVDAVLSALPVHAWPHGPRARRDGALLALAEQTDLTRDQIVRLTPHAVTTWPAVRVAGYLIGRSERAEVCRACALIRWLEVLDWGRWSTSGLELRLTQRSQDAFTPEEVHACAVPPLNWRDHRRLLASVDQYGHLGDSLSPRAVTSALTRTPTEPSSTPSPDMPMPTPARQRPEPDRHTEDLLGQLELLIGKARYQAATAVAEAERLRADINR